MSIMHLKTGSWLFSPCKKKQRPSDSNTNMRENERSQYFVAFPLPFCHICVALNVLLSSGLYGGHLKQLIHGSWILWALNSRPYVLKSLVLVTVSCALVSPSLKSDLINKSHYNLEVHTSNFHIYFNAFLYSLSLHRQ